MLSTALALWSLVVLFLILVCGMVPAFVQIRRTARQAEDFLRVIELELRPSLIEMKEVLRNLNSASDQVKDGIEKVGSTLEAIAKAGQTVHHANQLIRAIVFPRLVTGVALMAGLRVGLRTLKERFTGRR